MEDGLGKSSDISRQCTEEGNDYHEHGKHEKALIAFNKSLCYAPPGSDLLALAYSNRSDVFWDVKMYQKCIESIDLAQQHTNNGKIDLELEEMKLRCSGIIDNELPTDTYNHWNFLKLSYPANEKLPFIVNCLELHQDDTFGRHIVTTSPLVTGDIIAIEEPFFMFLKADIKDTRCTNCLKFNMFSLIPCSTCSNGKKTLFSILTS